MSSTTVATNLTARRDGETYRFDHPSMTDIMRDMYIGAGELGPGDSMPEFDLPTTDGGRVASTDLGAEAKPILLIFGSRTCPVTESGGEDLRHLYTAFRDRVRFVMVQVREAHPGAAIPQPKTPEQKFRHAVALKEHHRLPFEVAVDDIDGTLHRKLGARPNSAFLISEAGKIVFRAHWANEPEPLRRALNDATAGRTPTPSSVSRTPFAVIKAVGYMSPVLTSAGRGARADTWKVAPLMGAMMMISDLLFFLPAKKRGACVVGGMAIAAMLAALAGLSYGLAPDCR